MFLKGITWKNIVRIFWYLIKSHDTLHFSRVEQENVTIVLLKSVNINKMCRSFLLADKKAKKNEH